MIRFFVECPLDIGKSFAVPDSTRKHMQVLRLATGIEIEVFNGDGSSYLAQIIEITRKDITINIKALITQNVTNKTNNTKPQITLAMSIIASDKMDLVIQKATELNIYSIIPIITKRTQQIAHDRLLKRQEHWQRIGISSAEQCGRNLLPIIEEPIYLDDYLQITNEQSQYLVKHSSIAKFILSPHTTAENDAFTRAKEIPDNVILLVGPEGGFTENEVKTAIQLGFTTRKLGHNILRAETAAIAGLTAICVLYNWHPQI